MDSITKEEIEKIKKSNALELEKLKKINRYCVYITKISKQQWVGDDIDPYIINELEIAPLELAELFYSTKIKSITHVPVVAYGELGILTTIIYE